MGRFIGKIGVLYNYAEGTVNGSLITDGVSKPVIQEIEVQGTVENRKQTYSAQSGSINDNLLLRNSFSILLPSFDSLSNADGYIGIIYIEYLGTKWKVESIATQRPRLSIEVGDVWKGS